MPDYSITTDSVPTQRVLIVLDRPDDWWAWIGYIQTLAKQRRVWKYVNPDNQTITVEEPVEPFMPQPAKPIDKMTSDERLAWQEISRHYDREERKFDKDANSLSTVWQAIQSTVSHNHWHIIKKQETVRQTLIKLRDKVKPDKMTRQSDLNVRYTKLGPKRHNQSIDKWLNDWTNVISACEDMELKDLTGYSATLKFIDAVREIDLAYGAIRRQKLREDNTLSVYSEINEFRHQVGESESRYSGRQLSNHAFATFQGQSNQSLPSQSDRPLRDCLCGEKHRFDDCYYLILDSRPSSWRPDPKIVEKIENKMKGSKPLRQAIERAIK